MQGMLTGKEFPQQEWQEHLLWKTRGQNQNNMFMLYKIKQSIWIESWNTHIHQRFVFFTVLEKIKSGVHVRLLQDEIVRIYRENMMFCLHILSAAKNNGLLPLTQKDIAYIWRWLSCVLSASSRSSPRRCEEGEVLPAETLATVCHAWCRCTRPSALLLGSSCSGKSSLFWRGIQQDQELFKQTNKKKIQVKSVMTVGTILTFSGWAWQVSKWHQICLWGWSFLQKTERVLRRIWPESIVKKKDHFSVFVCWSQFFIKYFVVVVELDERTECLNLPQSSPAAHLSIGIKHLNKCSLNTSLLCTKMPCGWMFLENLKRALHNLIHRN